LYSITTNQAAIIALFRVMNRYVGNLPPMPGVFPDYPAPVVRNVGAERELTMMRWGMPPPSKGGPSVTNIRNASLPHWRGWMKPENRCLVPANSFAEYAPEPNPETRKKRHRLVCPERRSAADGRRRHLDRVQERSRNQVQVTPRPSPGPWFSRPRRRMPWSSRLAPSAYVFILRLNIDARGTFSASQSSNKRDARTRREPQIQADETGQKPKATWVEPKFYADVEYRDITSEGLLRQSSFKGLYDKS
jgi:hypothetical protein